MFKPKIKKRHFLPVVGMGRTSPVKTLSRYPTMKGVSSAMLRRCNSYGLKLLAMLRARSTAMTHKIRSMRLVSIAFSKEVARHIYREVFCSRHAQKGSHGAADPRGHHPLGANPFMTYSLLEGEHGSLLTLMRRRCELPTFVYLQGRTWPSQKCFEHDTLLSSEGKFKDVAYEREITPSVVLAAKCFLSNNVWCNLTKESGVRFVRHRFAVT
jgi:hypothetical protein